MGDLGWVADRIAIQDVLVRYCRGIDRGDADLVRSVYWPDSYDDHGAYKGSGAEFADYAVPRLNAAYSATHHTILNSTVDLDGDVAHTETYVEAYHVSKPVPGQQQTVFLFAGRYVDRLEKRDGEWRIKHRVVVYDFDRVDPIERSMPESWTSTFTGGRRDRDDLSYGRA
jgi:hypothetical protein